MKRAHLFISGRVQGVFFRSNTRKKALELGLGGWVRNLNDGRVEAVFEGEESAIEKVIDWCHQGPTHASVDDVEVHWEEFRDEFKTFSIRY
ncbi:MAG: acylphosphatase [Theionarchaea archaeon]|nr:acylphosphatase [Theionarchaea archaeon]MBU7001719.1 acylphosphatase [Theionarchaea archaeon]MBU7021169.1 acylphosphatase [Theionarchaea archaeon]MBU7034561.1 acylphosphatase [Theionarchaea archaeon]MBU7040167.1 acylphosphatase [Theionarchaea archaeon]